MLLYHLVARLQQFKFLVVFKYSCIGSASAVITEIFTGAISARRLAWFWEERSNH
ncbi:hypothetical protein [Wolbachia endosymbiont (group A) of Myopa testacea]|uniref:hypothetical protein n=1 Tax=Wolbachia endosymbiont (group A) of Myopa testacea TaxID=3066148 RepID=UPI0033420AC1